MSPRLRWMRLAGGPVAVVCVVGCSSSSSSTSAQNQAACPSLDSITITVGAVFSCAIAHPVFSQGQTVSANIPAGTMTVAGQTWTGCTAQADDVGHDGFTGCSLNCPAQNGVAIGATIFTSACTSSANCTNLVEYNSAPPNCVFDATWH